MSGVGPIDLHELSTQFLDACIDALDTIPTYDSSLGGAPARAFVAPGPPAFDCCDQLTVHVASLTEGDSAPEFPKASIARINYVQLAAISARCVPMLDQNGNPPPMSEMEASAEQINADKWALWNHIYNLIRDGRLFSLCCDVIWGPLSALQPQGGCGGSRLLITVCFDGYEEVPGT